MYLCRFIHTTVAYNLHEEAAEWINIHNYSTCNLTVGIMKSKRQTKAFIALVQGAILGSGFSIGVPLNAHVRVLQNTRGNDDRKWGNFGKSSEL